MNKLRYITFIIMLIAISAKGQYIETVCTGTPGRGYHVIGSNGSTFSWTLTGGGTLLPPTDNDTVFIDWGNTPGVFTLSVVETTIEGCPGTAMTGGINVSGPPDVEYTWEHGPQNYEIMFHLDTVFTNTAAIGNMIQWYFGDGVWGYGYNPVHVFPTDFQYSVTCYVQDTNGCTNSVAHLIDVHEVPWAFFATDAPVCFGKEICLTDLSNPVNDPFAYITTWIWNFGDGTSDTIHFPDNPNVCHLYTELNLYNITLKIIDNNGYYDSYSRNVSMMPEPIAAFEHEGECEDQPVIFTDISSVNGGSLLNSWSWNFGDPASGTANLSSVQNPAHTFISGGDYLVTLIITNTNTCTDTVKDTVHVRPSPALEFSLSGSCLGSPVSFTADTLLINPDSIVTWSWNFGDNSPASSTPVATSHSYISEGSYDVTLTIMDVHGCYNSVTHTINVTGAPVALFEWNTPLCSNQPVQFGDNSYFDDGYITEWHWDFGDGTDSVVAFPSSPEISHVFASGLINYPVKLTITTNNGCTDDITNILNLVPAPVAEFSNDQILCPGSGVHFYDQTQASGYDIVQWHWNFGDPFSGTGNISQVQNPVHSFTAAGNYLVSLIVRNVNDCSDTIERIVTVGQLPLAQFDADTACFGSPVIFNDFSVPNEGNLISWHWDFGDGQYSAQPEPDHTYSYPGTFLVTLSVTNSNGCKHDTTMPVIVLPQPVAAFSHSVQNCSGEAVYFTDESYTVGGNQGFIVKWTWDFGDGFPLQTISFPGTPDISHVFPNSSNSYTVILTVKTSDSCESSITHSVTISNTPVAAFTNPEKNCPGKGVQFHDNSNGNGNPVILWNWNFGDPLSGTGNLSQLQNPGHIFSGPGNYTVRLIVSNVSGCSDTTSSLINVSELPIADFSSGNTCLGNATVFTNLSSVTGGGQIMASHWEFGDGAVSNAMAPVHVYQMPGNYQVELVVISNDGCTTDTIKGSLVLSPPPVQFINEPFSCAGTEVQFTDVSPGNTSCRLWNFGDGVTVSNSSPVITHVYQAPGNYNVSLSILGLNGCQGIVSHQVHIITVPSPDFTFSAAQCPGIPVAFNGGTPGVSVSNWLWNFGDPASGSSNTSTLQNPIHTFSGSGNFNVTLSVITSEGCTGEKIKPVLINQKPLAQFTSEAACAGNNMQFNDGSISNSGNLVSWQWNFGDPGSGGSNYSASQNPVHIFASPGTYIVHLTVTNSSFCQHDTLRTVVVEQKPVALFEYSSSCAGTATSFTDLSSSGSQIISWNWDFGDGTGTSSIQNPQYVYSSPGNYQVTLRVENSLGCTDSMTMAVVSNTLPEASYNYHSFYCPAGRVSFQDASSSQGQSIVSRLWIFEPGLTSNQVNPVHVFSNSDTSYQVQLIVTDSRGCKDTTVSTVDVKQPFSFSIANDTVCYKNTTEFHAVNNTPGDSLWFLKWDFGDPNSGSENFSEKINPVHVFTAPGNFPVKLRVTNSDNCTDSVFQYVPVNSLPAPYFSYEAPLCESIVYFTDSTNGGISQRTWSFGDGTDTIVECPSGNTVTHNYVRPGQYTVSLRIVNESGCSEIIYREVARPACLEAAFTGINKCANSPVIFTDNSLPADKIGTWHWNFGDGSDTLYYSFNESVSHTYSLPGNYRVSLIISAGENDSFFADSALQIMKVSPAPMAEFSVPLNCTGYSTHFTDLSNSGEGTNISHWDFGDPLSGINNYSEDINPVHVYDSAGTYVVKLHISNNFGCDDLIEKSLKIYRSPVANFESGIVCSRQPIDFENISLADTTINEWHWNFGVNDTRKDTSLLENPSYIYAKPGIYPVRLVITDDIGCSDTADRTITVKPSPVSAFMPVDYDPGVPGKVRMMDQSEGASVWFWDFGNGETSGEENPVVTFDNDGSYNISLITSNQEGCSDTVFYKYEFVYHNLFIPNAFAPFSSAGARLFKPAGVNLLHYRIEVYDGWGHMLWSSTGLDNNGRPIEGWDGTDPEGRFMPQGTYMWKVNAEFTDGYIWKGSDIGKGAYNTMGTVTLIR